MTAKTSRALETRRALVRAAIETIQASGTLQPDEVASRAGVSTATFYTHFSNKDVALTAVVSEVIEMITAMSEAMLGPERLLDLGLEQVIGEFVESSRDFYRDHSAVIRLAQTRINEFRPMGEAFLAGQVDGLRSFQVFVERAQRAGFVRDTDAQNVAHTLMATIQSLNNRLVFDNDEYLDDLSSMIVWFLQTGAD